MTTVALSPPPPVTRGSSAWCSHVGAVCRWASGRATHSCAPCSRGACSRGDSSEWEMPRPEVISPSWPGRSVCRLPRLSRCSTSPSCSQLTVCRPMCGCGGTCMPGSSAMSSGPYWSTKAHAPTIRRPRLGSSRRTTVLSPSGTFLAGSSSRTGRPVTSWRPPQVVGVGWRSRSLMEGTLPRGEPDLTPRPAGGPVGVSRSARSAPGRTSPAPAPPAPAPPRPSAAVAGGPSGGARAPAGGRRGRGGGRARRGRGRRRRCPR